MAPYPSQPATKRIYRELAQRPVWFAQRGTVASALATVHGPHSRAVVYLVGPRPLEGWAAWSRADVPSGWELGPSYFEGAPVMRYEHASGLRVEVHSAASWFGETTLDDLEACTVAWRELGERVGHAFPGCVLLATPATTGRELFARTIPHGREYAVMSNDAQELVRSISGQGRVETIPGPAVPALYEYDGRLMYAALAWELPCGEPERDTQETFGGQRRGWYLVRAQVPRDWPHAFGLLGVKHGAEGWRYPHEPGERFNTWTSGAELLVADRCGWEFSIRERLLFPQYRGRGPLDTWAHKLTALRDGVHGPSSIAARVRFALRSIVLHGIGAFQGRPHVVTESLPLERAQETPAGARDVRVEGERVLWAEESAGGWANMAHPEWCGWVWARARARLLSAPLQTGALHVRGGRVVAFRTDALYLTAQQDWRDDLRAGRFRLVRAGHFDPPADAPTNGNELLALRRRCNELGR